MVAREPSVEPSAMVAEVSLGQRLLDYYETFMAVEPLILHRHTGGDLSMEACHDAAGQAYLNVATKVAAGELKASVKLPAYLHTAARNLAIDELRIQKRVRPAGTASTLPTGAVPGQRQPAHEDSPLSDLVKPAINAMAPGQRRQVVHLQSLGLTDVEICAAMGIRTDRLYRERYNAVTELRETLATHIRDGHQKKTRHEKKDR
ncbi:RNA polymerase sigma factor [Streptomyces sp. NBC_01207]|uniref:RNA polymerase sigma factor n=1 Tax=Streptomyces sp. NBC_01207 TaxID=2903772 RepID=UPI002E0F4CB8|nr:hypothetical protein OG457_48990 [Streptomyces sp. NBC_01207]